MKVIIEMIYYLDFMRLLSFFQHTSENGIICHDHGTRDTEFVNVSEITCQYKGYHKFKTCKSLEK